IADGQHRDLGRIEIVDDLHIAEHGGVAGVIEPHSAGQLENIAAGLAAVHDAAIVVLNAAGVHGVRHCNLDAGDGLRPALVHGGDLLGALLTHPGAELKDPDHDGVVLFGNLHGVADVVHVTVGTDQYVGLFPLLLDFRTCRIAHHP